MEIYEIQCRQFVEIFRWPGPRLPYPLSLSQPLPVSMWPISLAWVLGSAAASMRGIGGMSDEKC